MNTKTKRRLVMVTGVIIIVMAIVLAVVGASGAAQTVTVAQAASGDYADQRVEVSGSVVDDSFSTQDNTLVFSIYDPESEDGATLDVSYEGAASSTFGNDVTAICTGIIDPATGTLVATELVTKCPSKYESATDALSVAALLEYGEDIVGTTVRIAGTVQAGTLTAAGSGEPRFVVADAEAPDAVLSVQFSGALPENIADGTAVVITGALSADGSFAATDVAQQS